MHRLSGFKSMCAQPQCDVTVQMHTHLYHAGKCVDDGREEEVGGLCTCCVEDSLDIHTFQKPAQPQSYLTNEA